MILETIITTLDAAGEAHVTPFGVQQASGNFIISPYKPSKTLENILETKHAVMNLTDDVRVFAGALTQRQPWQLLPTTTIKGVRLVETLAHHELKLVNVEDDAERPSLIMQSVNSVTHAPFKGFNRAQAAVIELAVLVSRLHRLPREKILAEWAYLKIAIDKTAGEQEQEAWQWLTEKMELYYQQNSEVKSHQQ